MATINIVVWALAARAHIRRRPALSVDAHLAQRLQLLLSALYVFGCAYRSVFLVYDVPRICLWNTWLSSVAVGRSVATVAELCFVAQWALLLRETSLATGSKIAYRVSLLLVPMIAIAETCSWYSVLTTSNLGHVAEESLWGLSVALLVVSVLAIVPRCAPARRPVLLALCAAGLVYVAFMFVVDVPMYWSRWMADEAAGRPYLTIAQGITDVAQHRVVSYRWENWKHEVAWMSLYFSAAVWLSISLTALRTSSRWSAQCRRPTSEKPTLGSQILATSTSLSRN
jgi:hypothetical protein